MKIAAGAAGSIEDVMAHMRADHTSAEDAGRNAQDTGMNRYKMAVLSHIVPPFVSDEAWLSGAGKHFRGEIIVGHDLAMKRNSVTTGGVKTPRLTSRPNRLGGGHHPPASACKLGRKRAWWLMSFMGRVRSQSGSECPFVALRRCAARWRQHGSYRRCC
jgi:hypothetical protein